MDQPVSSESIVYATVLALPYAVPGALLTGPLVILSAIVLLICAPMSAWVLVNPGEKIAPKRMALLLLIPYFLGVAGYFSFKSSSFLG